MWVDHGNVGGDLGRIGEEGEGRLICDYGSEECEVKTVPM